MPPGKDHPPFPLCCSDSGLLGGFSPPEAISVKGRPHDSGRDRVLKDTLQVLCNLICAQAGVGKDLPDNPSLIASAQNTRAAKIGTPLDSSCLFLPFQYVLDCVAVNGELSSNGRIALPILMKADNQISNFF